MAIGRVFEDAIPAAYSGQRSSKAAAIIAKLELVRIAWRAVPEAPPALAWRMSYNRMRPTVFSRITRQRPRIHIRQTAINPGRLNV
jgi:hypothetical protein